MEQEQEAELVFRRVRVKPEVGSKSVEFVVLFDVERVKAVLKDEVEKENYELQMQSENISTEVST
jgi:hypothetical protein